MDVSQEIQKASRLEREGKLEAAICLYGKAWRVQNRPRRGASIDAMWRLGLAIFEERREFLERALSQTKLTHTMREGLQYLRDIPQSLALLGEYFYDESNDDVFRSNTIKAVGLLDDPRRIPFLSDILQHSNSKFRIRAIYALQQESSELVLKPLKRALTNKCLEVRFGAMFSLYKRKQASALSIALQQCITREEQYRMIIMLGKMKFLPAAPLVRKFLQAQDRELICLAAETLTELEDVESLPLLKNLTHRFSNDGRLLNCYHTLRRKSYLEQL